MINDFKSAYHFHFQLHFFFFLFLTPIFFGVVGVNFYQFEILSSFHLKLSKRNENFHYLRWKTNNIFHKHQPFIKEMYSVGLHIRFDSLLFIFFRDSLYFRQHL